MSLEIKPTKGEIVLSGKGSLRVLILDDFEPDRMRLARLMRRAGLECALHEAEDLQGFYQAINTFNFDLVMLDYHLAMDTGIDALRLLRAHDAQKEALAIMVTSANRADIAVEAMRIGCSDYLIKEELTEGSVRKSIVTAFERKILFAALDEERSSREAAQAAAMRLARACRPEMTAVLSATLRHARMLRNTSEVPAGIKRSLTKLESSCTEMCGYIDALVTAFDEVRHEVSRDVADHG